MSFRKIRHLLAQPRPTSHLLLRQAEDRITVGNFCVGGEQCQNPSTTFTIAAGEQMNKWLCQIKKLHCPNVYFTILKQQVRTK